MSDIGEPDKRLIHSQVWHGDTCFYVSTIDRDSSAAAGHGRFSETLVWEYDFKTNVRGRIIGSGGGYEGSIKEHFVICKRIIDTGRPELEAD